MSKIYFGNELIWNRNHLPDEEQAGEILMKYIHRVSQETKMALSCGIDVEATEGTFRVVLSTDERIAKRVR